MPEQLGLAAPSRRVGIVGAGVMGRGIAAWLQAAGHRIKLFDPMEGLASRVAADISASDSAASPGRASLPAQAIASLDDLGDSDIVVEAIREDLEQKRLLFAQLDLICPDAVLATNTSALSVTEIAAACRRPQRVVGWHFFNPVSRMRVAEVVAGLKTNSATIEDIVQVTEAAGHRAIRATDTPGFLINHLGRGYGQEAVRIVGEGAADPIDIDRIMREAHGFRMGPFELLDLTGLDVSHPAITAIHRQYFFEPRYQPSPLLAQRLAGGLLGRKTGLGFYAYVNGRKVEPQEPPPSAPHRSRSVWLDAAAPELRAALQQLIERAGGSIDHGHQPAPDSLCIVMPEGSDASTRCAELALDPTRTVALDTLGPLDRRRTLMLTAATNVEFRDLSRHLFSSDQVPVTLINDSAGFVGQRILANMVNIACEVAQQRIASPQDIDDGARLGLGYPRALLRMGDELGPARLLRILERLHAITGEPRYRPSPWLRRRVVLKLSLLVPEAAR